MPRNYVPHCVLRQADMDAKRCHGRGDFRPTGVAIPRNRNGWVLFLQSVKDGHVWTLPQGKIEEGEGAFDGALRELSEEAGFTPSEVLELCGVYQLENRRKKNGFTRGARYYVFHVACDGFPEVTLKLDEVCDSLWVPPCRAISFVVKKSNARPEKQDLMIRALRVALHSPRYRTF